MANRTILKIALIICLSSLTGCFTTNYNTWYTPPKPKVIKVEFVPITNGYLVNENDAKILANNIDEMKAYEAKMELLIKAIAKSYNIKLEENK